MKSLSSLIFHITRYTTMIICVTWFCIERKIQKTTHMPDDKIASFSRVETIIFLNKWTCENNIFCCKISAATFFNCFWECLLLRTAFGSVRWLFAQSNETHSSKDHWQIVFDAIIYFMRLHGKMWNPHSTMLDVEFFNQVNRVFFFG